MSAITGMETRGAFAAGAVTTKPELKATVEATMAVRSMVEVTFVSPMPGDSPNVLRILTFDLPLEIYSMSNFSLERYSHCT